MTHFTRTEWEAITWLCPDTPTDTADYCSLNKAGVWRWEKQNSPGSLIWITKKWWQKSKLVLQFSVSVRDHLWEALGCGQSVSLIPPCDFSLALANHWLNLLKIVPGVPEKMLCYPPPSPGLRGTVTAEHVLQRSHIQVSTFLQVKDHSSSARRKDSPVETLTRVLLRRFFFLFFISWQSYSAFTCRHWPLTTVVSQKIMNHVLTIKSRQN